ncbi:hypothetical protein E2562_010295 [Oryza meyeriana var. granulata]|uniref:Uncharacterized protein n=1 Tax=Oryza meyeriana var. granulata TaxID=110450 RepID=A0A6G1F690_9ORYZ|nr:hypothetical protein E2562_010295 [Oryza meyeriana var. granulata]
MAPYPPMPTKRSMECPNGSNLHTTSRSSYVDEETSPKVVLELGDGEDKDLASYIITKDLPKVMLTKFSTICPSSDAKSDLTVAMVVTCATTATVSMELVTVDDAISSTIIDNPSHSKEAHAKGSTVGLDVKGGTNQAMVVFPLMASSLEFIKAWMEPSLVMGLKLDVVISLKNKVPIKCSMKCPESDNKPLMEHPKRNPWPPSTHNDAMANEQALQLALLPEHCKYWKIEWK